MVLEFDNNHSQAPGQVSEFSNISKGKVFYFAIFEFSRKMLSCARKWIRNLIFGSRNNCSSMLSTKKLSLFGCCFYLRSFQSEIIFEDIKVITMSLLKRKMNCEPG